MSFALYKVKFDGDIFVRAVTGNYESKSYRVNDDNCTSAPLPSECWNNYSIWDEYSSNPATPLSSLFDEPKTVKTVNDDIASKPSGLGVYLKCGAAELKFDVSTIEQRSMHLLNAVPNSLFMLMMVYHFPVYFVNLSLIFRYRSFNCVGG
jgi:hypothetical protein